MRANLVKKQNRSMSDFAMSINNYDEAWEKVRINFDKIQNSRIRILLLYIKKYQGHSPNTDSMNSLITNR